MHKGISKAELKLVYGIDYPEGKGELLVMSDDPRVDKTATYWSRDHRGSTEKIGVAIMANSYDDRYHVGTYPLWPVEVVSNGQ